MSTATTAVPAGTAPASPALADAPDGTATPAAPDSPPAAEPDGPAATGGASRRAKSGNTGARTPEAEGRITDARSRIDALDDRIIGLVQERMAVSAVIQEARIASGGRRVNLSREMEILDQYRRALGKPGTSLAMTLLELCRGRV